MNKYTVNLTDQAKEHLLNIGRHISWVLKAPKTAADLIDLIEKSAYSLATFPKRCPLTEEEPWHTAGVRRMPVKNHLVYYLVVDVKKQALQSVRDNVLTFE